MNNYFKNVVETPMVNNGLTKDDKMKVIEGSFKTIMQALGLDLNDDSLAETPHRLAKMYVNEIFAGLNENNFPKITTIENKMQTKQMVVVKDISVLSVCEHHFQPIHGLATVAYIPNKKIIGLSKLSRVTDFFATRPQVQERLTLQIAQCLQNVLETEDVAVYIDAKHYCMIARGVRDQNSSTVTTEVRGKFLNQEQTRLEFLAQCRK